MEIFRNDGHLSDEALAARIDGTLTTSEETQVEEHLQSCHICVEWGMDVQDAVELARPIPKKV